MPATRALLLTFAVVTVVACNKADGASEAGTGADSAATSSDSGGSTSSNVSLPVVVEEVANGDLVLSVNTTGQVRSDAEGRLRAEVGGRVDRVLVRPGDFVRKGQVIAESGR